MLISILSKSFRCSNESNQKAIRDRSSKVETDGSSQAFTTPRLATQSRRQCSVLTCPVTPSYSVLPQLSPGAPGVMCECFRPHRPGAPSTRGLLGVAPRLRGPISGGGKNVCSIAVRIHQHTLYLDQGHQGLGSSHESTRDTLSLVHRRLSTRSTLPATCSARTEDGRRSLRSDSPRSPGRGNFNGVCHRLDQGPPPAMPGDFEIGQGHSVPVGNERQERSLTCSYRHVCFLQNEFR